MQTRVSTTRSMIPSRKEMSYEPERMAISQPFHFYHHVNPSRKIHGCSFQSSTTSQTPNSNQQLIAKNNVATLRTAIQNPTTLPKVYNDKADVAVSEDRHPHSHYRFRFLRKQ